MFKKLFLWFSGTDALTKSRFLSRSSTHLFVIVFLGLICYSNTFNAPFQWDEGFFITDNPIVKDLHYFLEPSKAKGYEQYSALKGRYIGYLTFALNYRIHGLEVTGYHIFNLAVHILNALLVYFLIVLTFKTPFFGKSSPEERSKYIALVSALIFVSHPVQTEAVTYIFQRLASLATFFYLLSLVLYIKWRSAQTLLSKKSLTAYLLSLVSAVLAMKTKENAFTLPLLITFYEFFFFRGAVKTRILRLVPLLLTLLIIPLTLVGIDKPVGEIISGIVPDTSAGILKGDYLSTQFRVVVTYIRLLFLPVNQNIDYDYPVFHSFFNPQVFISFLFLLFVFCFGIYLYFRSRFKTPALRLGAFGILWFFITLSVESSIIPIPMVINEYRVYLPSAGAFPAIIIGTFLLLGRLENKKIQTIAVSTVVLIPLVLSFATYTRNSVWKTEISLWKDVVRKSPRMARGHNNLGNAYRSKGLTDKAVEHYKIALRLKPDYANAYNNLGNVYASKGLTDKAVEHYKIALRLKPDLPEVHNNLGNVYASKGLTDKAVEHYKIALRLRPDYAKAHNRLGEVYASKGLTDKAVEHYKIILRLKPDSANAHYNLGVVYSTKGSTDKAVKHYRSALKIKPDFAEAHFNLGLIYLGKGLAGEARREFERTLQINPASSQAQRFLNYISNANKIQPH